MKRILYISHCLPYPPDKGERTRAFHEIRALSGQFRVTLACLARDGQSPRQVEPLRSFCEAVVVGRATKLWGLLRGAAGLLGGRSVTESLCRSGRLARRLGRLCVGAAYDLVVGYSSAVLPYVLSARASARVMDLVDIDSLKWRSYAERAHGFKSLMLRREWRLVADLERRALEDCDAVVVVCGREAEAVALRTEKLHVIANGVDTDYFQPLGSAADAPPSVAFLGTMSYRPNAEAVCWFAANVWPALRREFPDARFFIVGRDPPRRVRELGAVAGITVTGTVPDVRPYISSSRVAVAPLQMARGVQNKVLEAMAMARPVVASAAAIGGLDACACAGLIEARTPAKWVGVLSMLLRDGKLCADLGNGARRTVLRNYDWDACMEGLVALCRRLSERHNGARQVETGAAGGMGCRGKHENHPAAPARLVESGRQ